MNKRDRRHNTADAAFNIAWKTAQDEQDAAMKETHDAGKAITVFWSTFNDEYNEALKELAEKVKAQAKSRRRKQ